MNRWMSGARRVTGTSGVIITVAAQISPVTGPERISGFWELYETTLPRIYAFLLHRSDPDIAEDLTQEVYLTAVRVLNEQPGEELGEAWLFAVARSRLCDHFRARGRAQRNRAAVAALGRPEERLTEDEHAARHFDAETVAALETLSAAQRAALVMHHVDDLSVSAVADRLGRSVRATESLLARARHEFRSALEEVRRG